MKLSMIQIIPLQLSELFITNKIVNLNANNMITQQPAKKVLVKFATLRKCMDTTPKEIRTLPVEILLQEIIWQL